MKTIKQLPFANYFDQAIFESELKQIFANQPNYVGAYSELAHSGDYKVVERFEKQKLLVNDNGVIELFDHPCAPMMKNIDKSKYSLYKNNLSVVEDLLFTGSNADLLISDLKKFPFYQWMDMINMKFNKTYSEEFNCNWKHYIEVFAENYHVPFVHPGFSQFVDLDLLEWSQHERYTGQIFKMKDANNLVASKLTPKFQKWYGLIKDYYKNEMPPYAGILMLYYPNIIIECYPLCMAVGTIHSTGPEKFISHVDFFHHKDVLANRPDIVLAAEEALNETETEDKEMCRKLAAGRRISFQSSNSVVGPFHSELEKGLSDFYNFYFNRMNQTSK